MIAASVKQIFHFTQISTVIISTRVKPFFETHTRQSSTTTIRRLKPFDYPLTSVASFSVASVGEVAS